MTEIRPRGFGRETRDDRPRSDRDVSQLTVRKELSNRGAAPNIHIVNAHGCGMLSSIFANLRVPLPLL